MGPTTTARFSRVPLARAATATLAAVLLAACASSQNTWDGVYAGREDAPLPAPSQPTSRDLLSQAAIDLETAFASRQEVDALEPQPDPYPTGTPEAEPRGDVREAPDPEPATEPVTLQNAAPVQETPPEPAAAPADPAILVADLTGRIAQILGDELRPDEEPLRQAARLLALEMLSAGSAGPELRALEDAMLPPQREAFHALRGLFQELADSSSLDQRRLADLFERQIEALPRARPLEISTLRLCAEVDGFGRYTPMPTTFAAGRPHAALVYVEIENFQERRYDSARDGWTGISDPTAERWVAQLGQEIALLDDRNDHVALHEPEQIVRDIARRRRRDFYTVQRIELPAQLAIGKYHLKVTVRDLVDGEAVAEKIVPIEITAR